MINDLKHFFCNRILIKHRINKQKQSYCSRCSAKAKLSMLMLSPQTNATTRGRSNNGEFKKSTKKNLYPAFLRLAPSGTVPVGAPGPSLGQWPTFAAVLGPSALPWPFVLQEKDDGTCLLSCEAARRGGARGR